MKLKIDFDKYNVFFYHTTLQNLQDFFIMERSFVKLSQIVLQIWEICLLPLVMLSLVTRCRRILRIRKCLSLKPFILLVVLVLLWRDSIIESFLYIGICFFPPSFLLHSEIKREEIFYVIKNRV
jgi:hypothetical protein